MDLGIGRMGSPRISLVRRQDNEPLFVAVGTLEVAPSARSRDA
jgi:hypothetical protein